MEMASIRLKKEHEMMLATRFEKDMTVVFANQRELFDVITGDLCERISAGGGSLNSNQADALIQWVKETRRGLRKRAREFGVSDVSQEDSTALVVYGKKKKRTTTSTS
jgi:hypothetical protein